VSFPDAAPALFVNLGPLALSYVLSAGGSGYFRTEAIHQHLEAGRLHLVTGAPRFSYPVYVVSSANADESVLAPALAGLRTLTMVKGDS
jgi:LysR family transcriptional regulator, flagellar master operon regulator